MENLLLKAIQSVQKSEIAFSKFITANDTGATGGHQAGYHLHKNSWPLFFDKPGVKGENKDKFITIKWQDDFETVSRAIYYGVGTRNEYRLTRFGKGFPFLQDDNIGDLLILSKFRDHYEAYVLRTEEDIEGFFTALNLSINDANCIIPKKFEPTAEKDLEICFDDYIEKLEIDFPPTNEIAARARECYNIAYSVTTEKIIENPDIKLMEWLNAEFLLFKKIENHRYSQRLKTPFLTLEELIETANTILNRRKSRAGKSLEHHLSEIFNIYNLRYDTQPVTEDNKRPDFLFPGAGSYHNPIFDTNKLVFLAAKTTCKDRWRQILNEADRIKTKHLFTLQQGISENQLCEMFKSNVHLVIPRPNLEFFPLKYRNSILTLRLFIDYVREKQG